MRKPWTRCAGSEWYRQVENKSNFVLACVRMRNGRYEVSVGRYGEHAVWIDYCAAAGVEQEYKAKRKATAMAKKLLKGG